MIDHSRPTVGAAAWLRRTQVYAQLRCFLLVNRGIREISKEVSATARAVPVSGNGEP